MSPAIKNSHFAAVIKFVMFVCLSVVTVYALFKGNFIVRGIVLFAIASACLFF